MRAANISEARENLAELLKAVENGEDIIIMRRDRAIAILSPIDEPFSPFPDRTQFRSEIPPMKNTAAEAVRELRDDERY